MDAMTLLSSLHGGLLSGLLWVAPPPLPSDTELVLRLEPGAQSAFEFTSEVTLRLVEQSLSINGDSFDHDDESDEELEFTATSTVRFTDEYRACEGGVPTAIARRFDELTSSVVVDWQLDGESHEEEAEAESALAERTVLFTWDEEGDTWSAAYDGDDADEGDEALLEELVARCDLAGFLPRGKVEEGASWEVDALALLQLLEPTGEVHLRPTEDDDGATDQEKERWRQYRQTLEGEVTVTFNGTREVEGVVVAALGLVGKAKATATLESLDEDGDPVEELNELGLELEGEILWEVAGRRPVSYSFEGDFRLAQREESTWVDEDDGEQMSLVIKYLFEGPMVYGGAWTWGE